LRKLLHPIVWIIGTLIIAGIALIAGTYLLADGPPWPTDPEIHPRDTVDGSSLIVPLTVRNRSGLFALRHVSFRCGVDLLFAADADNHGFVIRDTAAVTGTNSVPSNTPLDYRCDLSKLFRTNADRSLTVYESASGGGEHNNRFKLPFRIIKMCIWVGGKYRVAGALTVSFTSKIFQWPAAPDRHRWIEGPVAGLQPDWEQNAEARTGLISGTLQCSDSVRYPYALVTENGYQTISSDPMFSLTPP
jgi:hypothetical protein